MDKTPEAIAEEIHGKYDALKTELDTLKTKESVTPKQLQEANDAFEKFKSDNTEALKDYVKGNVVDNMETRLKKAEDDLEEAQTEITAMKENGTVNNGESQIAKAISENHEAVKKSCENKGTMAEFVVKANVTRASVTNSTDALRLNDVGQLAYRNFVMRSLFRVINVGQDNNGVVRYTDWDAATIARAAAMVAEGGVFPESTAAWQEYSLDLHKIGDSIPVTEEMLFDQKRFADELEQFLNVNVAIVEDNQLYAGSGAGTNLTGLFTSAPAYVPVASGITDASVYDLLIKVSESIATGRRSKYSPDFVLMNVADINKMILKKDANNNYIRPPFGQGEALRVGGLEVIESNAVTANTCIVGDRRFAAIYEVEGYNVSTGMVNDQFTRDLMTMKAKKRMNLLVREVDKTGFAKVTDITAALTTLTA